MAYLIFDLETSTYSSYGRKANPFDKRNYIVSWGLKYQDGRKILTHVEHADENLRQPPKNWLDGVDCIVGINLKFDLHFVWEDPELHKFFKRGGRIYDCQYARYLVTAQQHKYASMNEMSEIYGGSQKEDKIKEYWQSGVQTIDIPQHELLDYLDDDLENTEIIFKGVRQEAADRGMVKTVRQHMEGLCSTIYMEYNGLKIDWDTAKRNQKKLEDRLEEIGKTFDQYLPKNLPDGFEFNWSSGDHLSALLFGGSIKYIVKEHQTDEKGNKMYVAKTEKRQVLDARGNPVKFKTGKRAGEVKTKNIKVPDKSKPKMRNTEKYVRFKGLTKPKKEWALAKDGVYKTDAKVLEELASKRKLEVCEKLLEYKKHDKDLGTYYQRGDKGMLTLVQEGDIIHHQLNNVQTETGRLSSSKPNMQNLPRGNTSEVREMFVSRFGEEGVMAEIDYSQLEVIVQAFLTRDDNLIADVNSGVDFHCKRLSVKIGEDYDKVLHKCKVEHDPWYDLERTKAKGFSFQRAYGAGKKAIAASTGMPEDEVQALIDAEDKLYPKVNFYNKWVARTVKNNAEKTELVSFRGYQRHFGWHPSPTGKRYGFTEYDAPDFLVREGIPTSFKPTEMKNYSVQGAAGEMVLAVAGLLWRKFVETSNYGGKAFIINSVHDCFWFDCHKDVAEQVMKDAEEIMVSIPEHYKKVYGIDVPVRFRVDIEQGPNMKDLH